MKNILINPFEKYAGKDALISGIALAFCLSFLSLLFSTRFDGVLDIHYVSEVTFRTALTDQLYSLISLTVCFYTLAFVFGAKNTRLIDIAGTFALARIPLIVAPLINSIGFMSEFSSMFEQTTAGNLPEIEFSDILRLIPVILIIIAISVWMIALSFNAWKVSTNLKGTKLVLSFIIGLICAEILSKSLILIF